MSKTLTGKLGSDSRRQSRTAASAESIASLTEPSDAVEPSGASSGAFDGASSGDSPSGPSRASPSGGGVTMSPAASASSALFIMMQQPPRLTLFPNTAIFRSQAEGVKR